MVCLNFFCCLVFKTWSGMAGVAHDLGGRDRQSYLGSWPACSTELVLGQEGYTVKNNNKKYMVS